MKVRLDKWLWAARFFKTRALARDAIDGGKVAVAGQRAKPAKLLAGGETLQIRKGYELFEVEVLTLAEQRGPAKVAQTLYQETEESLAKRTKEAELRKLHAQSTLGPRTKPDKKQRRQIHRFKQKQS
jgi:ribosome-associated heat shock protein Hsp15